MTNAFFISEGTPTTAIHSVSGTCSPLTICPNTATSLHSQNQPVLIPFVFDVIEKLRSVWLPEQQKVSTEHSPALFVSPGRMMASLTDISLSVYAWQVAA